MRNMGDQTVQQRRPSTGNGRSWGTNTGHLGQGILYGWAAKRAIEAEQRRRPTPGESEWTSAAYTLKVFALNCTHIWVWIVHSIHIAVSLAWPLMDIDSGGSVGANMVLLVLVSLPTAIFIRLAQAAFGDEKRRYEGLPPKRPNRRFVPRGMVALAIAPTF